VAGLGVLFAAVMLAAAASARTGGTSITETAVRGTLKATFSYIRNDDFGYSRPWLTISTAGRVLFDGEPAHCEYCRVWPYRERHALSIADIDRDGKPEVMLDTYAGGAHCCLILYVYSVSGGRIVHALQKNFASYGYRKADLDHDGRTEYLTGDSRFDYVFSSFAESFDPVRILDYRNGAFVTVTGKFPAEIRKDEQRAWSRYMKFRGLQYDVRGALAGWAADKYMLREGDEVWPALDQIAATGYLNGFGNPEGRAFLPALQHELAKDGYLSLR